MRNPPKNLRSIADGKGKPKRWAGQGDEMMAYILKHNLNESGRHKP